jgi:hypothetical protein
MNRYKNRTCSKAEDNPLKAFKINNSDVLSPEEETSLLQGVAVHGFKWDLIAKEFLPHRQGITLARSYQKVMRAMAISQKENGSQKTPQDKDIDQFNRNFLKTDSTQTSPISSPPSDDLPRNFFNAEDDVPFYYGKDIASTHIISDGFEILEDLSDSEQIQKETLKCNEQWTDVEPEALGSTDSSPLSETDNTNKKAKFQREEDWHILQVAKTGTKIETENLLK